MTPKASSTTLSEEEACSIEILVRIFQLVGFPKSMGEIYGLLFLADHPLSPDMVMTKLQLSRGSTFQGIKALQDLGAIKPVYVPGDRKGHFVAESNLRNLVGYFIQNRVNPSLDDLKGRIQHVQEVVKSKEGNLSPRVKEQVEKLTKWEKQVSDILPMITKILVG